MFSFHHVALSVSDLERSTAFYTLLGFEPVLRWRADDESLTIQHLKRGEALLELFCYAEPVGDGVAERDLAGDLPRIGIRHFGLRVEDIGAALVALDRLGLAEGIEGTHGRTGIDYFFVRDPDGIFVEVVQDDRAFEVIESPSLNPER